MCNTLHVWENEKIPEKGIGYKIVGRMPSLYSEMTTLFGERTYEYVGRWIEWGGNIGSTLRPLKMRIEEGFCFFLTLEEAENAFSNLSYHWRRKIIPIEYEMGMGSCLSQELDGKTRRFAFCKKWRLKED